MFFYLINFLTVNVKEEVEEVENVIKKFEEYYYLLFYLLNYFQIYDFTRSRKKMHTLLNRDFFPDMLGRRVIYDRRMSSNYMRFELKPYYKRNRTQ